VEATHHHEHAEHAAHEEHAEHGAHHEHDAHRPHEDWANEEYVAFWLEREGARADQRQRQFAMVRSLIPKEHDQEFRYVNLGAGPGNLDEVLLAQFHGAQATLVDGSLQMLAEARKRLERFENRVEFVQANLASPEWTGAVKGPFDVAVSTIALHNLRDPNRLRQLYTETYGLLGHGGIFLNYDYVRIARPELLPLARWATKDPDSGFSGSHGGSNLPGTVEEQLGWLREAGFACAECFWKEFQSALMAGIRDHLHLPDGEDAHGAAAGAHTHDGH
jgi:tRNA (cmo5U34)-methyltransferase